MKTAIFRATLVMLLIGGECHVIAPAAAPSIPAATPVPNYPNTTAGLEQLMVDMIASQKNGDSKMLAPYLQSLVLPDAERWFTSEFGDVHCDEQSPSANDCMGPRLAFSYQSLAEVIPSSFALTLEDLYHEGLTNFEATNVAEACSGPIRIAPARKLLGGLTTTPMVSPVLPGPVNRHEPMYALWIYSENKQTKLPFFVYSEGAFRYLGILYPASFDDLRKAKSKAQTPEPTTAAHYLTEDQLEVKDAIVDPSIVQRTIVLHVVTSADGRPKEVTYVRGPEGYKEVAIENARSRRFNPPAPFPGLRPSTFSFCLDVVAPR